MIGYVLTELQANELIGQEFAPDCFFNPVPDKYGVKFIFSGEVDNCINEQFLWVKNLPQAEFIL